jgi:hypothetical protein
LLNARPEAYPRIGRPFNKTGGRSLQRKRAQGRDNGRRKQDDQPHGTDKRKHPVNTTVVASFEP